MSRRQGLGRGLGALIPPTSPTGGGVTEVPIESIAPNPHQPRHTFDPAQLEELAASIREHGLIQPLIVSVAEEPESPEIQYRLIAGERRLVAAKLAGLDTVPVIIKEATPQQMLEWALVENIQRADLNPLEEANAYRQLIEEFGLSQSEVAERVGKSRVAIANVLRLLRLPDSVRSALAQNQITEGHARALLGLEDEPDLMETALRMIIRRGLSVRQTEELVRRLRTPITQSPSTRAQSTTPETQALEEAFRRSLGTKVQLFRSKRGGKLVIHFYSDEELQRLYDILVSDTSQAAP